MLIKDKSSPIHIDSKFDATTHQYIPMTSNDRSALFVVEVVGDAQFRHADGSVPLEAGMFIHFRGDLEHYTHVNKGGEVTYLGLFNVNAFAKVDRPLSGVDRSLACGGALGQFMNDYSDVAALCAVTTTLAQGPLLPTTKKRMRQLEEGTSDNNTTSEVEGEVVMGNLVDPTTNDFSSNFIA